MQVNMEILKVNGALWRLPALWLRNLGPNDEERAIGHTRLDFATITSHPAHTLIWDAANNLGVPRTQA